MNTVVIIPARYNSSRYPGKPLVPLLGKPMILWVAELSARAVSVDSVYVATEDQRIAKVVEDAGFQAVITTKDAMTGTDRLAQAAERVDANIYINVQGDEPLVRSTDILKVRDTKLAHMDAIVCGMSWLGETEDPHNVNIPKVITNERGELVYMSRAALPGFKDAKYAPKCYRKQVCIYAFTKVELFTFCSYGRKSQLEQAEDIELLRFLELGKKIIMVETQPGSLAVDVPDDVAKVESLLKNQLSHQ